MCLLFVVYPGTALAAVRINEIAWMGSVASSTAEWVELANDGGSPVDLSVWRVEAEDGSPSISLAGVIGANGYFLIERTNDLTVPNTPADLVASFGTGLSNSGETLRLKDGNGAVVDTVVGGTNWVNIGGNNTTKETAQFTATGWITGTPTPRAINLGSGGANTETGGSGEAAPIATTGTQSSATSPASGVASGGAKSNYPRQEITVSAGEDQHAFVGFPVIFSGGATGLYDEVLNYATYHWNFGDGATGEGGEVSHTYLFPGDYIATLEVFWGTHHNTDRRSVTVTDAGVYIKTVRGGKDGFTTLVNHSSQEVDLGFWHLRDKGSEHVFVFPPHTMILTEKTLTLPNSVTGIFGGSGGLELSYPNSVIAFAWSASPSAVPLGAGEKEVASVLPRPASPRLATDQKTSSQYPPRADETTPSATSAKNDTAAVLWAGLPASSAQVGEQVRAGGMTNFFGLASGEHATLVLLVIALLLLVLAGFIVVRGGWSRTEAIADGYTVIDEIIEGVDEKKRDSE